MAAYLNFTSLQEAKLTVKDRRKIDDSEFGIPSLRKYPLHDRAHILSAIKLYGHCPAGYEKELAMNIKRKMKEYNIPLDTIGPDNKLRKYL